MSDFLFQKNDSPTNIAFGRCYRMYRGGGQDVWRTDCLY